LPTPCPATRNLSFLRFHRRRHTVVSSCCFTGLARVGMKIPQDGNRANRYEHVAVVHGHVWRMLCSVCTTGARVAHPVPCKLYAIWYLSATPNARPTVLVDRLQTNGIQSPRSTIHRHHKNTAGCIQLICFFTYYYYTVCC